NGQNPLPKACQESGHGTRHGASHGTGDPFAHQRHPHTGFDDTRLKPAPSKSPQVNQQAGAMVFDTASLHSALHDVVVDTRLDLDQLPQAVVDDLIEDLSDELEPPRLYADFLDQPYIDEQSDPHEALIELLRERITEYVEDTLRQSHHDAVAADIYEALFSDADPYCLAPHDQPIHSAHPAHDEDIWHGWFDDPMDHTNTLYGDDWQDWDNMDNRENW
ncbi:MAG: hypothetical protein KC475_10975, partial [Cyanobacteria bacterium HKST-UBA03]|nr:hypothetical protein [Cyanobacteria bacterium HKST-UBA03]